ncbi:uncharacterized protein HMPREF1541_08303 [Cyphellophora europaea CBS 101466]|uniref:Ureidoglycolate hydrolase n=1 Tax=Cyphellophora europaea (strain CBS 101466) TaxID=1220924 RepID=W2RLF5_CYPE1|nr:uncharacterized protein HMPREF1541_08303 [Cyphellophora europaea CBS 101466]ETN37312.1 hypothetical protein HMPREF1541_08303 [Cyphellophora europaea CBS 101466]
MAIPISATLTPTSSTLVITPKPFTPTTYARYGTCVTSPLESDLQSHPSDIPQPRYPEQMAPESANQRSALKSPTISTLTNNYASSTSPSTVRPSMSLFCSFPRKPTAAFPVTHIERHPYTSQTFVPTGLANSEDTFYLVVSAPTLEGQVRDGIRNPPDLDRMEAFVARGDQAVTYAAGTWHSPMIVVGTRRVDFVVYQWVNGVVGDDCELCQVGGEASVDLSKVTGGAKEKAKL